jgi:hypothetical protein
MALLPNLAIFIAVGIVFYFAIFYAAFRGGRRDSRHPR